MSNNRSIYFLSFPGMSDKKTLLLQQLGIEFKQTYIPHHVPCQTHVKIEVFPKNELELYASFGVFK